MKKVPEVEISPVGRYSSQLQLSSKSQNVRVCVCPLVRQLKLWYFPTFDFSETWYGVTGQ